MAADSTRSFRPSPPCSQLDTAVLEWHMHTVSVELSKLSFSSHACLGPVETACSLRPPLTGASDVRPPMHLSPDPQLY